MTAESADREVRNLVAVNADVVGYSRLMADDPVATTETVEAYRRLAEERVAATSGTFLDFVGDNFMAVFDDAMAAIEAAIAITVEVEARGGDTPPHRRVRFRMGLDQGEVTRVGGRYFGDALNIAARIQAKAPPGGISVSGGVFRALDEPALRFRSLGPVALRNIPEPVEVFEFADLPADGTGGAADRRVSLESPVLVVLPIHTETVDDDVRRVAEVIRADLLHRLSGMARLRVVDGEAGDRGGGSAAQYMLETGVHRLGGQVRVYAKVLHVATMNVVTSHRWAAPSDGLADLDEAICDEVARGVAIELVIGEQARLFASVDDPDVARRIYEGWFQLTTETYEGWRQAVRIFEEVAAGPDDVYGHVLAAFANWTGASMGFAPDAEAALQRAFDQAAAVVDADDPTGLAHMVLGAVHLVRGETDRALEIIEQARITRPTCEVTYALEGSVRRYMGQWQRAVDLMDTAVRMSAVPSTWYLSVMACALFIGGRLDRAAETATAVVEHDPGNLEALLVLSAAQHEMGLERRARATAAAVADRYPGVDVAGWLDTHPFRDAEFLARWRADLAALDLVSAG